MDASVKPGDDVFRYVNGKWLDRTEIPADKLEAGGLTYGPQPRRPVCAVQRAAGRQALPEAG